MKKIATILLFICLCISVAAQTTVLTGKISDMKGEPIIGATVVLEGSSNIYSTTDVNGEFSITVPSSGKPTLVINCLGFQENRVQVAGQTKINIVLKDDMEQLEEVVVIGYGAMKRSDLTGSLSSVNIDEGEAARSQTLVSLLEGGAAGVDIVAESIAPDSGFSIQIRGVNSFSTSTEPLFVVDGVIINSSSDAMDTSIAADSYRSNTETSTNGLAGLNPSDIANVEILKDASATAIYGSQGANGVVLITTKMASKDKTSVSVSCGVDVSIRDKRLDMLTFDEYIGYLESAMPSTTAEKILTTVYDGYVDPTNRGKLVATPIDWQDYMTRTGVSQRYGFTIMGRPKGYSYLFSLSYKDNMGVLKGTDSKTLTARINIDRTFSKKLKLGFKVNGAYTYSDLVNGSNVGGVIKAGSSVLRSMLCTRPYVSIDPEIELEDVEDEDFQYGPNRWVQNYKNNSTRYTIQPSLYLQWGITDWLTFKTTVGGDFRLQDRVDARTYKITRVGTTACVGRGINTKYNWDVLFLFNKQWGKHNLSGTLGMSLSGDYSLTQMNHGWQLDQPYAEEFSINSALPEYTYYGYSEAKSTLMSYFARAVYNYRERYILTATGRFDGSSKFAGSNKWAFFPSFAFAWRMTKESWFYAPVISNLKLRAGWGQVGNQNISNYQTGQIYASNSVGLHSDSGVEQKIGLYPDNIPNPALKWETSQQVDLGIDFALWKGRVSMSFDAYLKDTKDLLQRKNISLSSGFATMYVNSGSMRNKGIEFTLDCVPVVTNGFEWTIGGNIAVNRNIITSVGQQGASESIYLTPDNLVQVNYFGGSAINNEATDFLNINIEGQPVGLFYGYVVDGIVKEGETAPYFEDAIATEGMIRYKDINKDGKLTDADRTIIGNPWAKFTYGFNTSFSYKKLTLSARFVGRCGGDIYNLNNVFDYQQILTRNVRKVVVDNAYDRETNPNGTFPAIGKFKTIETIKNSSMFVEDGSYFNLKTLALSYIFDFGKKSFLKSLNATLSCGNVFMITNYSGWSPKAKTTGVSRLGVELNSYPTSRTYSFDLKFNF